MDYHVYNFFMFTNTASETRSVSMLVYMYDSEKADFPSGREAVGIFDGPRSPMTAKTYRIRRDIWWSDHFSYSLN